MQGDHLLDDDDDDVDDGVAFRVSSIGGRGHGGLYSVNI